MGFIGCNCNGWFGSSVANLGIAKPNPIESPLKCTTSLKLRGFGTLVAMITPPKKNGQLVGNMGLYAVCYELSKRGWNAMPTSRNARGIDILGYSQCGRRTITVQVKALSKGIPVPLGTDKHLCNLIAEFVVVATKVRAEPEFFIAKTSDVRRLIHVGVKDGRTSCWLQPKEYTKFKGCWETIGLGW